MVQFTGVCLTTQDVRRLREFYQAVLGVAAEGGDEFASFPALGAQLALCAENIMRGMAPDWASRAGGGDATLEFEVEDVDVAYERLQALGAMVVKPPTTQPWGLRSVWFRDPDGNLINFYARV